MGNTKALELAKEFLEREQITIRGNPEYAAMCLAQEFETYAQQAEVGGEWHTMTDIPLDGSKIWLYSPETDLRYIAYWGRGFIQPKGFEAREAADGWINAACFEPYIIDARISNWMPLPPKPLARAEKLGV